MCVYILIKFGLLSINALLMGCLWLYSTHRLQPVIDTSTLNQLLLSLDFYYPAFHTYHLLHPPKSEMEPPENHTFATTSFSNLKWLGSIFIVRSAGVHLQALSFQRKRHQSGPFPNKARPTAKAFWENCVISSCRWCHWWHDESDGPDGDTRLSCQTSHDQNGGSSNWLVVNWDMFF